jgi:hypothetical protein
MHMHVVFWIVFVCAGVLTIFSLDEDGAIRTRDSLWVLVAFVLCTLMWHTEPSWPGLFSLELAEESLKWFLAIIGGVIIGAIMEFWLSYYKPST